MGVKHEFQRGSERVQVAQEAAANTYSMEHSSLRTENILENALEADPLVGIDFENDSDRLDNNCREELTLYSTTFDLDKKPLPQKLNQVTPIHRCIARVKVVGGGV